MTVLSFEKNAGTARPRLRGDPGKALCRMAFPAGGDPERQAGFDANSSFAGSYSSMSFLIVPHLFPENGPEKQRVGRSS